MKRFISVIFLFSMLLSVVFISEASAADETSTNLLLNGTAKASSNHSSGPAANAVDGNDNTYWRTNSSTLPHHITIALTEKKPMDRFVIRYITSSSGGKLWRDQFIEAGGKIKVSAADDANFTKGVAELGEIPLNKDGFVFEAIFQAYSKQAVRFTFEAANPVTVFVLEAEAYYTGAPVKKEPAAMVNLAAQQGAVIMGSTRNSVWTPEKVIDGLTGQGQAWQTTSTDKAPQLTVDFGRAATFSKWSFTNMLVANAASGNAVQSFVLEAADDAEFTSNYQLLYTGGPVTNGASDTVEFAPASARYFRFRVLERDMTNSLRIYEMSIDVPAEELRQATAVSTVYVPADGSRVYKVGGVEAYDAEGKLLGANPGGAYSLVQGLGSVSVCAINGNLTVPAGTPSGKVRVKAEFAGGSYEYDVNIDGDFADNASLLPSYVVWDQAVSGVLYQMKAMTLSESVPQELTAVAVTYTDNTKKQVASIQAVETKTLKICEWQELSFSFSELAAGRTRIFLLNGLKALQPVAAVWDVS